MGRVSMHANGVYRRWQEGVARTKQSPCRQHLQHPFNDQFHVLNHGSFLRAGRQTTFLRVGAIGKDFVRCAQPRALGRARLLAEGYNELRQQWIDGDNRARYGVRNLRIAFGEIGQRAMSFDECDFVSGVMRYSLSGSQLVGDGALDFLRRHRDGAPAKARKIGK